MVKLDIGWILAAAFAGLLIGNWWGAAIKAEVGRLIDKIDGKEKGK